MILIKLAKNKNKTIKEAAETVAASTSLIDDTKIQHSRTPNYAICAICRDSGKKG